MIPARLVDFVHGPVLGWIGTRNDKLRPSLTWVFGARVDGANDLITLLVPEIEADRTNSNLAHNGAVAFTAADGISHECYQFKGAFVESRPSTEEERAVQDILRSKLISHFPNYPEEFIGGFVFYPSTAITFRVAEIFVQTPGPGAGDKFDIEGEASHAS